MNISTRLRIACFAAGSALLALLGTPPVACADTSSTQSFVGALSSPGTAFETTLTLTSVSDVVLQTYGFGGGTNAQGTVIAPGGTDPFLAIFAGTGGGAPILTDASANPFGTSLDVTNYGSFTGCSPAHTVDIGGATCGDVTMTLDALAVGTYTIVLSDGQYIANAIFDNGSLGEGFSDFTGGVFCNLAINGTDCPNTTGAYALDVSVSSQSAATPEPSALLLISMSLPALVWRKSRSAGAAQR